MSRVLLSLTCVFVSSVWAIAAGHQQIAFERGTAIWMANADGSNPRKITEGNGPDLSPNGARIAFHTNGGDEKELVRQIAVVDPGTKKTKIFKDEIPSRNCQRAIWSPDGSQILFSIWTDNDWHLALINADGSGFRYVKKTAPKGLSLWSACWAPDGQSIYAQDLDNLYQLALDGGELKKWPLRALFPDGSFSSGSSFAVSPDGKTLLMDVDMDNEEANMPDWDGPPPSMWILDIASKKATRLTPKGILAWHGAWIDSQTIVFSTQSRKERNPVIRAMKLSDQSEKLLIQNGANPSVSHSASSAE